MPKIVWHLFPPAIHDSFAIGSTSENLTLDSTSSSFSNFKRSKNTWRRQVTQTEIATVCRSLRIRVLGNDISLQIMTNDMWNVRINLFFMSSNEIYLLFCDILLKLIPMVFVDWTAVRNNNTSVSRISSPNKKTEYRYISRHECAVKISTELYDTTPKNYSFDNRTAYCN